MLSIERAGLDAGRRRRDLARRRRVRIRTRRTLSARPRQARARPRRAGRTAARLVRALPDRVDRGPVRRGRRGGLSALHGGGRRPRPDRRRRPPCHERPAGRRRGARAERQRGPDQGQPGGHGQPGEGGFATKAARQGFGTIVSARSGETEDVSDRASRGRLGRRSAQGRLLRALRAHGEMERGACASRKRWAQRRASPGSTACRRGGGRCWGERRSAKVLRRRAEIIGFVAEHWLTFPPKQEKCVSNWSRPWDAGRSGGVGRL